VIASWIIERATSQCGTGIQVSWLSLPRHDDQKVIRAARAVILSPGVGRRKGHAVLRELRLDEVLRDRLAAGVPILGICVGLQYCSITVKKRPPCWGSFPVKFGCLTVGMTDGRGRPLTFHMGWNE